MTLIKWNTPELMAATKKGGRQKGAGRKTKQKEYEAKLKLFLKKQK